MRVKSGHDRPNIREAQACVGPVWQLAGNYQQPQWNRFSDSMRAKRDTYVAGVHLSAGATVENDRDDR
jgi:hypothetical protein